MGSVPVADDHDVVRLGLRMVLGAQRGFALVGEASSGREAVALTKRVRPNVVVMDLAMPELDGIEATRQLRQRHAFSHTPIFAISAYATHDVKDDALAAGCTDVFDKPIDLPFLLGKIQSTLETSAANYHAVAAAK